MTTTKREKQLRDLHNKIARMEAQREAAIKTLVRTETTLPKLRKQLDRIRVFIFRATQAESLPVVHQPHPMPAEREPQGRHDDGIPTFLRRGQAAQAAADVAISEEAKRLATLPDPKAPEKKAERKLVEKQVREAELTGKRRKLPLTGKQALAEINRQR